MASPPIENGHVAVRHGRIESVDRSRPGDGDAIDLGDVMILPGFVNAHTHLELTACHRRVPFEGTFADWIGTLTVTNPHREGDEAVVASLREGMRASLAAGVTTVGDIGFGQAVLKAWRGLALNVVGFLEVIGLGEDFRSRTAADRSVTAVSRWLAGDEQADDARRPTCRIGVTPHAPYSTDAALYREAIDFARRTGRPICTHLAETREEMQFLADGTGPLRDFLEERGLWDGSFSAPGCSAVRYAERLGLLACQPLLAHVNYASDDDLDLLARGRCHVAYCPRAHRFFGHDPHPYRRMLERGINVCIGTDSLACNETLSVLDELRCLAREDQRIDRARLIAMGTLAGARALRMDAAIGSLEVGKRGDMVVVPLTHAGTSDPLEDLLEGDARPGAVHFGHAPAEGA